MKKVKKDNEWNGGGTKVITKKLIILNVQQTIRSLRFQCMNFSK